MAKQKTQRPAKRYLVRWTHEMDTCLLLAVQQIANKQSLHIPWDEVGKVVDPLLSKGAVVQHLAKLRLRKIANNEPVPPRLVRGGTKNPACSSSRVDESGNIKKTTRRKGASARISSVTLSNDDEEEEELDTDQASDSEEDFGKSRVKRRKNAEAETTFVSKSRVDIKKEDTEGGKQRIKGKSKGKSKGKRASTSVVKEATNSKLSLRRRTSHVDYASIKSDSDDQEPGLDAEQYVAKNASFLKLTKSNNEASKTADKKGKRKGVVSANDITSRLSKMVTLNVGRSQKAAELVARIKGEGNFVQGVEEPDADMEDVSDSGKEGAEGIEVSSALEVGYSGTEAATAQDIGYTYDAFGTDNYNAVNYDLFDEALAASSSGADTFDADYMNISTNHTGSHLDLEPSPGFTYQNIPDGFFNTDELTDWADSAETTEPWAYPYVDNAGVDTEVGHPYLQATAIPTSQVLGDGNVTTGIVGSTMSFMGDTNFEAETGLSYANAPNTPANNFQYHNASMPSTANLQSRVPVPTTPRFATPTLVSTAFASSMDLGEDDFGLGYMSAFDEFFMNGEY